MPAPATNVTADGGSAHVHITGRSEGYALQYEGTWDSMTMVPQMRLMGRTTWNAIPGHGGAYTADGVDGPLASMPECDIRMFASTAGGSTDVAWQISGGDTDP